MIDFLIPKEELLRYFTVDCEFGLTDEKVKEHAQKYGVNSLTRTKEESLIKKIFKALSEPMILMLIAAAIITLFVNVFRFTTTGEADFLECVGIFIAIFLSVFITIVMEGKSAKAFEELNKINKEIVVKVLRNGKALMLNQKDIVAGDILLLSSGDKIPADGRLIESTEMAADESALTGESHSVNKDSSCVISDEKTPLAERFNMLYQGTFITGGFGKLLVTSVGDSTEFGKIARNLTSHEGSTPLQERLGRLGKVITVIGIIASSIVFISQLITLYLSNSLIINEVMQAFITSIVLIVAIVPEGLPTIIAVSLSLNIIKLSKQNALVKKITASETVGCVNVICSDKTGTLTENKMTVAGDITDRIILRNICVNSTAELGEKNVFIGNPTECALLAAAGKSGFDYREQRRNADILHTFPFSSEQKDMTTIVKEEDKYIAYSKGSPEKIFLSCNMADNVRLEIEEKIKACQQKAYRIIAFAHRIFNGEPVINEKEIESDMVFDGFTAISDPLRSDVAEAIERCRLSGIDIKMLTGDNIITATAIAEELNLLNDDHIVTQARELEELDDAQLSKLLPRISVIARSTPTLKLRIVNLLKEAGNVVAVTGDGINDAPALKSADVGIAMGISGTEVSKEASDIVLLNDSFSTIVNAIRWGRGIYENFKRFISFQLTVNVSSVIVVLTSIIIGLKTPFTALQLLWINIIMDGPPALTLGLEPIYNDLMSRPPVKRNENILSRNMFTRLLLTAIYISIVFILQYKINFLHVRSEQMPSVLFALFSLFHLFNAFNCRELHLTSIFINIGKNKLFLLVVSVTFILQILIIQYAGAFFGTVYLPLLIWIKLFSLAFSVIVLSEITKLILKIFTQSSQRL